MKSNFEMCEAARGSGVRSDKYWVSKVVAGSGITQKYHSERVCSFFTKLHAHGLAFLTSAYIY